MKNLFYTAIFILVLLCTQSSCKKSDNKLQDKICENGKCFSIQKFGDNLQTRLMATSLGHAYAIYYNNTLQKWDQNGEARRTQDGNVYNLNAINTKINVASCAKSMTAIAALKALEQAGVSVDAKIKNYLPTWWTLGSNIDLISFKDLLRQRSGFRPTSKAENYAEIKRFVAAGINADSLGHYQYQNMNFCIFRLLIPALTGDFNISNNNEIPDAEADAQTQAKFMQYMTNKVWNPFGAEGSCTNPDQVLYYDFTNPGLPGLNPHNDGNECENAGGGTISITTNNLAKIMYNARYTDKLLIPAQRDLMFNSSQPLGCYNSNVNANKNWGGQFHHNGGYEINNKGLAACWYAFHNGVVVAVSTNSFGGLKAMGYKDINDLIELAFDDAWE